MRWNCKAKSCTSVSVQEERGEVTEEGNDERDMSYAFEETEKWIEQKVTGVVMIVLAGGEMQLEMGELLKPANQ